MKRALAVFAALLLSACGGAPFDSKLHALEVNTPDGGPDSFSGGAEDSSKPDAVRGESEASTVEAGFKPDAPELPDALEAGPDALDAGHQPEASPPPPADSGPACTVIYPNSTSCSSNGGRTVLRPDEICVEHYGSPPSYTLMTTPSGCRCLETYTCACVLAAGPSCPSGATPSCTFGTMPFLFCPS